MLNQTLDPAQRGGRYEHLREPRNVTRLRLTALDQDRHHTAKPTSHLMFGNIVTWVRGQAGVKDCFDQFMSLKVFGDG